MLQQAYGAIPLDGYRFTLCNGCSDAPVHEKFRSFMKLPVRIAPKSYVREVVLPDFALPCEHGLLTGRAAAGAVFATRHLVNMNDVALSVERIWQLEFVHGSC